MVVVGSAGARGDAVERADRALDGRAPIIARPCSTTPACGAGTCHFGSQTAAERSIDGILFFNESADPTHWTDGECERMLREWCEFAPRGVEADPAYLAIIARAALKRGMRVPSPEFITLTYETTTRAMRRDIGRAFDAPLFQLYGATEAGVLFMECEHGRLHPNERHSHVDLVPLTGHTRLARVLVTTLGRAWMPLLRYDIGDVVRVAESRDCAVRPHERRSAARARRRPTQRLHGRARRDDDAADARRRDPRGARIPRRRSSSGSSPATPCSSSILRAATARGRAAAAVGALLERPIRGERVAAIAPEASGKYRLVKR